MKYFDEEKINTLSWSVLKFDDGKVDSYNDSMTDGGNFMWDVGGGWGGHANAKN
jgi:hypothetical protein